MQVQHVFDETGNETAVIIPIAEWRDILRRLDEPNAETIFAMEEGRNPGALKRYANTGEMWADLDADL